MSVQFHACLFLAATALAGCGSSSESAPAGGLSRGVELPAQHKARRDFSGVYDQFDIEYADIQMIHDTMTGRLPFDRDAPERKLSCTTLVQLYLDRIATYDQALQPNGISYNSVLHLNPTVMEQAARLDELFAADAAAANNDGLGERYLHCIPVLSKDNYDTFDNISSSGSLSLLDHQAGVDAPSIAGLRAAGAVIIGKANMSEFAFTPNPADPRNPGFSGFYSNAYDTSRGSGASSSGSGTATAARFTTLSTGSDSCGSIRGPSSANGLVGIRPSIGVISRKGIMPLYHYADTGGPMTKTIRDAALMLSAMGGVDAVDDFKTLDFLESERPGNYIDFLQRHPEALKGKHVALLISADGTDVTLRSDQPGAYELTIAALDKMRELGAHIYALELPDNNAANTAYSGIGLELGWYHYDVNQYFYEFYRDGGQSSRACVSSTAKATLPSAPHHPECLGVQGLVESGLVTAAFPIAYAAAAADETTSESFYQGMAQRRAYWEAVMDGKLVDEVIQGTSLRARLQDDEGNSVDGVVLDAIVQVNDGSNDHCGLAVNTEMGTIMVPIGMKSSGTPASMGIIVRRFDEGRGLALAYEYEQAIWDDRQANGEKLLSNPDITSLGM